MLFAAQTAAGVPCKSIEALHEGVALCAGVIILISYAVVQVTQVADAASFDVYDSDNHPKVS